MKLWVTIFILLIPLVLFAQPEPNIVINDFSGGLNTNTSLLRLKPNQGNIFLNWDIGEGYLTKRKGYMQLLPLLAGPWPAGDTLAGDDPTIGLFAFRRADGVRRICGIVSQAGDTSGASSDSTGLGWFLASPGLVAFPPGSGAYYYFQEDVSRRYYNYVYQGVTPHWTYWNDRVYMTNGRQRPLVFHPYNEFGQDGYVRELVPLTPGEPLIVPLDVTGNLNGEYFYMIGHSSSCGEALSANKVTNGDLESWTGNLPDNWDTLANTTGFIVQETDSVKNGSSSLRLTSASGAGFYPKGIRQTIETDADSSWQVSAWVHNTTNGGGTFSIIARDTINGNVLNFVLISDSTGQFIKYQFDVLPRPGRDSIELYLQVNRGVSDTIYFDSINVQATQVKRFAVVTKPVIANNENVLLTNFPWQTIVAGCAFGDAAYDVLDINIYRTKANPGEITTSDKFWLVDTKSFTDKVQIDTFTYIDTLSDDSFGNGSFVTSITIDSLPIGRDLSLVLTGVRVGAPTYVSNDSLSNGTNIFNTVTIANETFLRTSYICTYYDTLINAESDSGRSLHIFKAANENMYHIGLPPLPGGKTHLTRRLWKSYQTITTRQKDSVTRILDTTITVNWSMRKVIELGGRGTSTSDDRGAFLTAIRKIESFIDYWGSAVSIDPPYNKWQADFGGHTIPYRLKIRETTPHPNPDSVFIDTTETMYRLIAEIPKSDSVFVDSILYDSTIRGKPYASVQAPFNLNYVTSFRDRLWGSVGSKLYWSYLDTGSVWGSFRNLLLGEDDGDEITAIIAKENYMKIYKNFSQFAVFAGNEFEFERSWVVTGVGCIAPHSAISTESGMFYLSHKGLIREEASVHRERVASYGIISEPINNILLNRTTDALRKAYSYVHNNKYHLAFSDIDTTFVYHLKVGGWTIYDYAVEQAIPYDTLTENTKNRIPSTELVFINGENDQLYKADTTSKDKILIGGTGGNIINTKYRSAPFGIGAQRSSVNKMGLWRGSNDATGLINIKLINAEGDTVYSNRIDTVATRYDMHGVGAVSSNYFQWEISDSLLDSLAIDRIDTWIYKLGEEEIK